MSVIRGTGSIGVVAPQSSNAAANAKTAANLKPAILEVLKVVRFGNPLPANQAPTQKNGQWKAPNGDLLIAVQLSGKPPPGSADFAVTTALVNPKTNQFYHRQAGGIAGVPFTHGPLSLPQGTQFKGKTFSAADIKKFEALANAAPKPPVKLPTKKDVENAYGAYNFHNLLKWSAKAPPAGDVVKKFVVKKDNFPDGFTTTGLVLRTGKVVFQRTGGIAGLTQYSQAIATSPLPK